MTPSQPEATLAAIGLKAVLEAKPKYTLEKQKRARGLAKEARLLILKFLASSGHAPIAPLPEFDYDTVAKELNEAGTHDQAEALFAAMPGRNRALGMAVANVATNIILALRQALPRNVRETVAGSVVEKGSPSDVDDFARIYFVACDPLIVLRDLCEHILDPDQVQALQRFYPQLLEVFRAQAIDAVTTMKTKVKGWNLLGRRDQQFRLLMGVADDSMDLAGDFQAMWAKQNQAPAPSAKPAKSRKKADFDNDQYELPGQKG